MIKSLNILKKTILNGLLILIVSPFTVKGQDDVISAFRIKWENSKPYLLKMAEKMPAEHYNFKPRDRQMSFKEQLLHIRENMLMLSHSYIAEASFDDTLRKPASLTKKETMRKLATAFDEVDELISKVDKDELRKEVDFFAGPKTKLQILNLIQDHVTHHRGQLIVYLNLKGIEPPDYVGW